MSFVVFKVSAHNPIINYFFAAKSFYPRQRGKKRRYYEQEYIQDSFLHSEESSKQRRQVGNHDPFNRQWRNRTIQLQPKEKTEKGDRRKQEDDAAEQKADNTLYNLLAEP